MSGSLIKKEEFVNDIVHGMIKLPDYIIEIIDTTHFQRLRSISQLSFSNFVYPSANGTRFDHCIGTFNLASILILQVQKQAKDEELLDISDDEVKCVEIAALCHDLGHGPYSHAWEYIIKPILKNWFISHEELSCEIFRELINTTKSGHRETIKEKLHLNHEMVDLICRLILGTYDKIKDKNKKFLFEIIANKDSGLDVDKFDYLCRDIIHLGWSNTNKIRDVRRIIHFFRVVRSGDEYRLAMRDREIFHIYDIFYTRHLLHRYGYKHKTSKAVYCMFKTAIESILKNHLDDLIKGVIGTSKMASILDKDPVKERILCSKEFIGKACDYHIWHMMNIHTEDIVKRINERNLVKLFCTYQVETNDERFGNDLNDDIVEMEEEVNLILSPSGILDNDQKNIHLVLTKFSLASEPGGDPILKIPFYSKYSLHQCFNFDESHPPSGLVNLIKNENVVMVFIDSEVKQTPYMLKELNCIKDCLCGKPSSKSENEKFQKLRRKYKFREFNC